VKLTVEFLNEFHCIKVKILILKGKTLRSFESHHKIFDITIDLIDSTLIILHEYNFANVIQTYLSFINSKTPIFFYFLTSLGKTFRIK
jgi:hypothetical protein